MQKPHPHIAVGTGTPERLKLNTNWIPRVDINNGLERTINSYREELSE